MAKRLTVRQQVEKLRKEGHVVKTYERSDGGIRVIELDGRKFDKSDSKGNDAVRKATGQSLSKRQRSQRKKANRAGLSESESKAVTEANRLLKKRGKKPIRRREVAKSKKKHGWKDTKKKIDNTVRHAAGLAYPANVDYWADACRRMGFDDLADILEKNRNAMTEERLRELIELFYKLHNGQVSEQEAGRVGTGLAKAGGREGAAIFNTVLKKSPGKGKGSGKGRSKGQGKNPWNRVIR